MSTTDKTKPTEAERLAMIRKWESTPSPNREYRGATPGDAARALMRPRPK